MLRPRHKCRPGAVAAAEAEVKEVEAKLKEAELLSDRLAHSEANTAHLEAQLKAAEDMRIFEWQFSVVNTLVWEPGFETPAGFWLGIWRSSWLGSWFWF